MLLPSLITLIRLFQIAHFIFHRGRVEHGRAQTPYQVQKVAALLLIIIIIIRDSLQQRRVLFEVRAVKVDISNAFWRLDGLGCVKHWSASYLLVLRVELQIVQVKLRRTL